MRIESAEFKVGFRVINKPSMKSLPLFVLWPQQSVAAEEACQTVWLLALCC
jgi:hypothetical protein